MSDTDTDALTLLRAEVARTSKTATAERLGVSRTAVSLLVAGKYTADPSAMYARILDVLGGVRCPYLETDLPRSQCRRWHTRRQPPAQTAEAVRHWRACQTCVNNPAAVETQS
jgi:hypothetical protein